MLCVDLLELVDGAHGDKTVNRVNKVTFELIISFHVRGFRETEEEKIGRKR